MAAKKKSSSSGRSLVIVESPAKARTIEKYLGDGFEVKASMGHVRDLPGKEMSVDISNSFAPTYEIIAGRKKTVASLKKAAGAADMVYLAPDLDREGEAIAWHLVEALKIKPEKYRRVVFNAITRSTIQDAFAHPAELDMGKVYAQQARRILDRIVGYEISPLLWKKVARGLSAGRVQSVAVKLIVGREKEIQAFEPQEYWKISGIFSTYEDKNLATRWQEFLDGFEEKAPTAKQRNQWLTKNHSLEAQLATWAGKAFRPDNENNAMTVHKALQGVDFQIAEIQTKRTISKAPAPFITSTLQQQAANRLGFSTKGTMRTAQQLYEGMELAGLGSVGLITYMRTDSTHLAPEAIDAVRSFIDENFGKDYLPTKPNKHGSSNKSAQQAHEAIRPTDVNLTPERVKSDLTGQQYKLYDMIWRRFVACQMTDAQWDVTNVSITAQTDMGQAVFKAMGRQLVFDGFMKVNGVATSDGDQILPKLEQGREVWPVKTQANQHFTSPPARYTEASLVKTLEAEGIGRPSTYATIISTIQDRGYVEQLERKFYATDLGIVVTEKLNEHFPRVMDLAFTSHMEEQLDKIEEQHLDWVQVLNEFYGPFKDNLDRAHQEMTHAKAETQPSEYTCSECGEPMVYRFGKNGRFLSCSGYPKCKFASPCDRNGKMTEPEKTQHKCPKCGKEMILREGRFGAFLGCSDYPQCKTTQQLDKEGNPLPPKPPPKPSGIKCYKCSGELVIRESKKGPFLGCGRFPRCRTIVSIKQLDRLKELQGKGVWPPKTYEEADELLERKKKKAAPKKGQKAAKSTKASPKSAKAPSKPSKPAKARKSPVTVD